MIEKKRKTPMPNDRQPADYWISYDKTGQLLLRVPDCDEPIAGVRVVRCFPLSLPDSYISIQNKNGKEIVLIKALDELDPVSKEAIKKELRDKAFNPKIRRIVDCRNQLGGISISAETDRGKVTFQLGSRDDIRMLSPTRVLFQDRNGNIYELADLSALDSASRNYLQDYF